MSRDDVPTAYSGWDIRRSVYALPLWLHRKDAEAFGTLLQPLRDNPDLLLRAFLVAVEEIAQLAGTLEELAGPSATPEQMAAFVRLIEEGVPLPDDVLRAAEEDRAAPKTYTREQILQGGIGLATDAEAHGDPIDDGAFGLAGL